jgi:hypothetical protein
MGNKRAGGGGEIAGARAVIDAPIKKSSESRQPSQEGCREPAFDSVSKTQAFNLLDVCSVYLLY